MYSLIDILREVAAYGGADIKTDIVNFRVTVPTSGDITQASQVQLRVEYDYYFTELRCGCTITGGGTDTADADADDIDEIRINFRESGTGQTMFTNDIELSTMFNGQTGNVVPISFSPGGYKVRAGANFSLTVTRRATTITTQRVVVPQLTAILVPKDFHLRSRKVL